jgi:magnesium transporter
MQKIKDSEKWALLSMARSAKISGKKIPEDLGVAYMAEVVLQLTSDAAAELLRTFPEDFREHVIEQLPAQNIRDLREILSYPADTAGGLMAKEYLCIPSEMDIADAIEFLHLIPKQKKGKVPYVYTQGNDGKLEGVIQTKELVFNSLDTPTRHIMTTPVSAVSPETSQQELAKRFRDERLLAIPVTDRDGKLIGVVSADNMMQVIKEQADKDIAKMVGMDAEEMKTSSVPKIMRMRLPWLFVNIVSGLLCAFISGLFEHGIETITVLFLFVPVVLALSESTGIQGATIVVRNLMFGSVNIKEFKSLFIREIFVGIFIGLICALIVGCVTSLWQGNPVLGLAIAVSMNITIIISALIGLLLPILFKMIKIDPAIASGPLVLAICDIQTLCVYFNLAGYILKH